MIAYHLMKSKTDNETDKLLLIAAIYQCSYLSEIKYSMNSKYNLISQSFFISIQLEFT